MTNAQPVKSRVFPRSPKVLVVEDDAVARLILARWFDRWEVSYDIFASPTEVMTRLSQNPYCLALIDFHLPRMNGVELVREMRAAAKRYQYQPPTFAIHTTDTDARDSARMENIEWFLVKPVPHQRLASVLLQSGCAPSFREDSPAEPSRERYLVRPHASLSSEL